ncbi:hypothetical protein [Streptomyces beijiangensis]|uniref:Uncharacterized protein n=1 Tax=Streptomyces beijiangensis TaxID=163361 RepID=A0A939JG29_9ACTN|nr:hypothetical protein [Streptomyces beijiangensis]MBO0510650.1 hypothetical protein [Streptomyces beijiangensis]
MSVSSNPTPAQVLAEVVPKLLLGGPTGLTYHQVGEVVVVSDVVECTGPGCREWVSADRLPPGRYPVWAGYRVDCGPLDYPYDYAQDGGEDEPWRSPVAAIVVLAPGTDPSTLPVLTFDRFPELTYFGPEIAFVRDASATGLLAWGPGPHPALNALTERTTLALRDADRAGTVPNVVVAELSPATGVNVIALPVDETVGEMYDCYGVDEEFICAIWTVG